MMIEKDEPQTGSNELIEQETNQNEQGHHDEQPVDAINLEVTDNYVKATEGCDEIHKGAIFLLEFYKFLKRIRTTHPLNLIVHTLKVLIKLVR